MARLDQAKHRRPVRDLDAVHLAPRVGVRVEVDEPHRPVLGRAGANVGLRDRVVAAEHDRDRTRVHHLTHDALDRGVRGDGIARDDGASP